MKNELNIEEIKELIPHRYPFLLIDRLKDIVPFESATGIKNVTVNENFFQGHFENKAVMPGALIIESMAQAAGSLVLQHKVIKKNNVKNIWKFSCKTYVDSNLVAESELAAILSDNDSINNS